MYYLQSRYYNPAIGRFINADTIDYLGANCSITSYNLFTYCGNNPVMGYDPSGYWDWGWKEQAAAGTAVIIIGLALLLAPPTGGATLGALVISASTISAAGGAAAITGTVIVGDALNQATLSHAKKGKSNSNSKQGDNYRGNSLYNKNGERIDYEYYGNGNGNVHYDGTKGKEILWRLEKGIETTYVASKVVQKIINTPQIQKAIQKSIDVVMSLAGIK